MQGNQEPKKHFFFIYGMVAFLYVSLIITYSLVVHAATDDGAQNVFCVGLPQPEYCYTSPNNSDSSDDSNGRDNALAHFAQKVSNLIFLQ